MFTKIKNKTKGFTLIELLVVIAIIGLLATLAVVALNNARTKSRDAKRVSDIKQVQTALELYYIDESSYPPGASVELGWGNYVCLDETGWSQSGSSNCTGTIYMGLVPHDPSENASGDTCVAGDTTTCNYTYLQTGSGSGYSIHFYLEGATGSLGNAINCATGNGITSTCP
jgi:prepilin-type N-terminal cleavage/methylation domain-containing protein